MACTSPIKIKNPRKLKLPGVDRAIIEVPCGKCLECRKRYANDWRIRLIDELRYSTSSKNYFITFSISDEYYNDFYTNHRLAIRKFLERYRKKYKISCRHWIVTELGDITNRLHFHGILFDCKLSFDKIKPYIKRQNLDYTNKHLAKMWKYGHVYVGYCSFQTASYIVKYITKAQYDDGIFFKPKVYCSPGIGEKFTTDPLQISWHRNLPENTYLTKRGGFNYALPRYYKNKFWSALELRLIQIRHANDELPYRLKGKTYPPTTLGYLQYHAELQRLHQFNQYIYYDPPKHTTRDSVSQLCGYESPDFL